MKKYILEFVVFISGAVVMIFELVGSRILAPYMGTSLVVWTSIIGIILGSLSLGYFLGGKIADIKPNYKQLSFIILMAAVFIFFTAVLKDLILGNILSFIKDLRISGAIASIILFAPASIGLGMVSPYAVKLKIKNLNNTGSTVGNLYALSTIGSIVGTFSAGFFLIPFFGTSKIVYILSLILIFLSFILFIKKYKIHFIFFVIMFLFLFDYLPLKDIIIDVDSLYNRIWIIEAKEKKTNRIVRYITTDPHGAQSAVYIDDPADLVFDYLKFYSLSNHFNGNIKKALLIGGGIFTYPQHFIEKNKEAEIDVVEIDSKFFDLAREHFFYKDNEKINIIHEDGRTFLNNNKKKYDCIFLDVFNSKLSVPFQLTTKETVKRIYHSLNNNGLVMVNLISAVEGEKSKFLRAEYVTYNSVFPHVYVFPIKDIEKKLETQNIILVALKNEDLPEFTSNIKEYNDMLNNLWTNEITKDIPILTDDHSPVEFYVLNLI